MTEVRYWLGFNLVSGIGPSRFRRLLGYFGTAEAAWHAAARDLATAGLDARTLETLVARRPRIDLDREMERVEQAGVILATLEDDLYPSLLKHVPDAPPLLYVRGTLKPSDELAIAVVGTRRATVYGKQVGERLVGEVAGRGVVIVSGLARGIDAVAHRAALAAGGRTIAVVASGVDLVYPPDHAALVQEVIRHGAIVSEYPLGTPPEAGNFPARNRLISGMTRLTLVVEAGETSGALITANFALEQGRDVLAVPGSILAASSVGTNRLIQQGAKLVQDAEDILDELDVATVGRQLEFRALAPDDPIERSLLDVLTGEPAHIDEIVRQVNLPVAAVSSALAMLELKGMARHVGGMHYVTTGR
ncbi:MAG TPA: DNA-processing protein DprA [Chloroflexota bacterium]|nr:DNA-processing protein DprA [Chloroflexota bacterium]